MSVARALAISAFTVLAGACAHPGPVPKHEQPALGRTLVVLLPKSGSSIGGVVVRSGDREILLDKAYAGARVEGAGNLKPVIYTPERAAGEFEPAIAAMPARPATFLLYFLEGKDELAPDSSREVERVVADIAARVDPQVWVIGHADAVGTPQYNDQLSLQRAQKVRDALVRLGISARRIEVSARGNREPLVPTSPGAPEQKNRRVEVSVR
jgi:outer membrane protein OmpA-like peptidoglycan-associated protein